MKILITTDWYSPTINGVVFSVLNLRRGLVKRGHEVRILTLSQDRHSHAEESVSYIGSVNAGFVYPGARLRAARGAKLVRELIEWKPDVVHSNCEFSSFFPARKIAKATGALLVHTYHTVYEDYTHYFFPVKRVGKKLVSDFSRTISNHTHAQIVPTRKVADLLHDYGVKVPVYVIPTGIDQDRFRVDDREAVKREIRRRLNIPMGHTVPIFVGRLAKEKNCTELLKALRQLSDVKDLTLLIVGDGPYREDLEHQAKKLGVADRVVFAGMIDPSEVGCYYRSGDIFVSASTSETQGLTYVEALSCSLPVLCRKDDCLEDVVKDGYNGWQYRTPREFAEYLRKFMGSPELRASLCRGAAETGRLYSIDSFAESVERVYLEQIEQRKSRNESENESDNESENESDNESEITE